jgi:hypothetical protein
VKCVSIALVDPHHRGVVSDGLVIVPQLSMAVSAVVVTSYGLRRPFDRLRVVSDCRVVVI